MKSQAQDARHKVRVSFLVINLQSSLSHYEFVPSCCKRSLPHLLVRV